MSTPPKFKLLRYWVNLADERTILVRVRWTDMELYNRTARKHGWPDAADDKLAFNMFVCWSAARFAGQIDDAMTYEQWRDVCWDLMEVAAEDVDPTPPAPTAGSSQS